MAYKIRLWAKRMYCLENKPIIEKELAHFTNNVFNTGGTNVKIKLTSWYFYRLKNIYTGCP